MIDAEEFAAILARHMIRTGAIRDQPEAVRLRQAAAVCGRVYPIREQAHPEPGYTYEEQDDLSGAWRPVADGILTSAAENYARKATEADLTNLLALAWESAEILRSLAALTTGRDFAGEDGSAAISAGGFWPTTRTVRRARAFLDMISGTPPPPEDRRTTVVERFYRDLPIPRADVLDPPGGKAAR